MGLVCSQSGCWGWLYWPLGWWLQTSDRWLVLGDWRFKTFVKTSVSWSAHALSTLLDTLSPRSLLKAPVSCCCTVSGFLWSSGWINAPSLSLFSSNLANKWFHSSASEGWMFWGEGLLLFLTYSICLPCHAWLESLFVKWSSIFLYRSVLQP